MSSSVPQFRIGVGDCRELLRDIADNSIDSIVTDPPYELGFMGKRWDSSGIAFDPVVWKECLRVLKPGGHLLAFSGTRTQHRMVCAIEDAGFEVRDQIGWVYGNGFPKSLDISKAIDKAAGAEREVASEKFTGWNGTLGGKGALSGLGDSKDVRRVTAPATPEAQQWDGWGTALKPAWEPICVARKPLSEGTVAANVLVYGTGGINIGGCRVGSETTRRNNTAEMGYHGGNRSDNYQTGSTSGRWPANLIHDGSQEVLDLFPGEGETSAARFMYCAKASKADRDDGLDGFEERENADWPQSLDGGDSRGASPRRNYHPTVKPTALMAYLCRLVTPPGGTVLDPFTGSGSTGRGAVSGGFRFIGCELSPEYAEIATARIAVCVNTTLI